MAISTVLLGTLMGTLSYIVVSYVIPSIITLALNWYFPIVKFGPSRVTKVLYNPGHSYNMDFLYCKKNFKYMPMNVRYLIEEGGGEHIRTSGKGPIFIVSNATKHYALKYNGKLDTLVPNVYMRFGSASDNYETIYFVVEFYAQLLLTLIYMCLMGFGMFVFFVMAMTIR